MDTIVVELPAEHKDLADLVVAASQRLRSVGERAGRGRSLDIKQMEKEIAELAGQMERAMVAHTLRSLDVDAERVVIEGRPYVRVGRHPMTYYCMAGEVVVERSIFRPLGERNGKTVDPIALRAGLIEGRWMPATAQAMAHRLSVGTSREAEASSKLEHRLPYSRTSFETVGHAVGKALVQHRAEVEQALIERYEVPAGTKSIGVALDRGAMAFEEPRKRPPGRPRKDAPKRPIQRVFHMAWSGTVTMHDANGNVLDTIHYGREPSAGAELVQTLLDDVRAIREAHPELPIVLLADGAHELWNLLEPHFADLPDVTSTVDFWHLGGKLAAAAKLVWGQESVQVLAHWKRSLLRTTHAVAQILDDLHASGMEDARLGETKPVHEAITYLTNHQHRMRYAANRRRGLPIGSGPVEANAKSLYTIRMKRPGARWKPETADHVLQLRAHALSNRFEAAVEMIEPRRRVVRPLPSAAA